MSYETLEAIRENRKIRWIDESPGVERCKLTILYDEEREAEGAPHVAVEVLIAKLANIKTFSRYRKSGGVAT